MPKVSVILTSYNHGPYLREAIDSVLNQTFSDFELIIWDDASQDDSWEVICSYQDSRIRAFRNDEQKRGIWGINKAISEVAAGEYIAIHHSDDIWESPKLEKQIQVLDQQDDIGAVFTNVATIDGAGNLLTDHNIYYTKVFEQQNKTRQEWLRQFFLQGNSLCHPSGLIRKEVYTHFGLYRYGLAQVGDFDMWIRLCMKYEIHIIPEMLVKFRVQDNKGNTSAIRPDSRRRIPVEYLIILDSYLKISGVEEVVKIFPECAQYILGDQADCGYLLARAALDNRPFGFTQLWGLKILFDIVSDAERSTRVKEWHKFDYMDFIALTGQFDVFGYDEIARLNAELQEGTRNEG